MLDVICQKVKQNNSNFTFDSLSFGLLGNWWTDWYHSHIRLKMQLARLCRKATNTSEDVTRLENQSVQITPFATFPEDVCQIWLQCSLAGTSWQANSEAFGMFVQVGHGLTWCGKLVSKQVLIWISISCEVALSSGALFLPNWWVQYIYIYFLSFQKSWR